MRTFKLKLSFHSHKNVTNITKGLQGQKSYIDYISTSRAYTNTNKQRLNFILFKLSSFFYITKMYFVKVISFAYKKHGFAKTK